MKRLLLAALLSLFAATIADKASAQESPESPERGAAPAIVEIEVTLAQWTGEAAKDHGLSGSTEEVIERVKTLEKQGALAVLQRFKITTVDGHAAMAQQGENRPRVTGASMGQRGGGPVQTSISYGNTGTLVGVTPTVTEAGPVLLKIELERSAMVQRPDAPVLAEIPMGEKTRAESTTTLRLQTMLRIASGKTALLAGLSSNDERQVALVSVKVVK